jgi:hypothetical protein
MVILGGHPSFKLKISGINVFINKFDDDGAWLGTFEGYSFDDGSLIVHKSGYILFKSTVSFESPVVVVAKNTKVVLRCVLMAGSQWKILRLRITRYTKVLG